MKLKDLMDVLYGDFILNAFTEREDGIRVLAKLAVKNRFSYESEACLKLYGDYKVTGIITLSDGILNVCCENN